MKTTLHSEDRSDSKLYVGLDIHKKTWHGTFINGEVVSKQSFNSGTSSLITYINRMYPNKEIEAYYEAGYFGYWIQQELEEAGIQTSIVNPSDIPTTHKDKENKTDPRDSRKLAESLKNGMLRFIYMPYQEELEYRSLLRERYDLVRKQTRIKNQIKAILQFYGKLKPWEEHTFKSWSKEFINWLESLEFETEAGSKKLQSKLEELEFYKKKIKEIEKYLEELANTNKYKEDYYLLQSIPGIGKISAITLLFELVDINRFKLRDEYLSYIGMIPRERSSGEKRNIGGMTKRSNISLRTLFIEASWIAIKKDPELADYYNTCCQRMIKTKAIIKVANKLAARTRRVLLSKEAYKINLNN